MKHPIKRWTSEILALLLHLTFSGDLLDLFCIRWLVYHFTTIVVHFLPLGDGDGKLAAGPVGSICHLLVHNVFLLILWATHPLDGDTWGSVIRCDAFQHHGVLHPIYGLQEFHRRCVRFQEICKETVIIRSHNQSRGRVIS